MYMGKKVLLAVVLTAIMSGSAFAEEQGSGKIKFQGIVIDAPCSIAPDSVDKVIDLGEVTTAVINANKKSTPVPVEINLENCQLDDPADETDTPISKVDVTFTSAATDATDTSLMSNTYANGAQNVGVRLLDIAESTLPLGEAKSIDLLAGSTTQTLHFKAVMEVLTGKTATAGQVEATANYVLMYK
ncbi:fimbrial protein [Enterobacter cloacae]|uniref:fimbrial protein n=1 Tax=Enterobacter cloacae TaxID=550 RepID=UPI0013EF7398|nr:fimbrial protein [Enterobacter cloacae]